MKVQLKNPQTGIYIKEFMEETLAREIARAQRHERAFSIAIIQVNGTLELEKLYGLKAREQALNEVASRMQLALRQSDSLIGSWGDCEFLICLMECNLRAALSVLERLKLRVQTEPLRVLSQEILTSLNVGIATFRPGIKSEPLVQEAQHALKAACQKGPNQTYSLDFGSLEK